MELTNITREEFREAFEHAILKQRILIAKSLGEVDIEDTASPGGSDLALDLEFRGGSVRVVWAFFPNK